MALPYWNPSEYPSHAYRYASLSEPETIRLVHLMPGAKDSEIICSLTQATLAEGLGYEAVSYTWGDPAKTNSIRCGEEYIGVAQNLHCLLYQLRQPDKKRILWIDALCINQGNVAEKTEQVRCMRNVYAYADQVLIWLGTELHTDFKAFGLIKEFGESDGRPLPDTALMNSRLMQDDGALSHAVAQLIQRPYFRRVWVIQEIAMARKARVICGGQSTWWETLVRFVSYIKMNGLESMIGTSFYTMEALCMVDSIRRSTAARNEQARILARFVAIAERSGWGSRPGISTSDIKRIAMIPTIKAALDTQIMQGPGLVELLEKTQIFSVTDARDAVFALLGIASDKIPAGAVVDYSLTKATVYKRLAIYRLVFKKDLSYLSFAGRQPDTTVAGLPSWVPDWSVNAHASPRSSLFNLRFKASGSSKPTILLSPNGEELSVSGFVVETILRVGERRVAFELRNPYAVSSADFHEEQLKESAAIEECDDIAHVAQHGLYPTGDSLAAVYWRLMICNRLVDGSVPPPAFAEAEATIRYLLANMEDIIHKRFDKINLYMLRHASLASEYGTAAGKWLSGRRFCATEGGYLGWVPMAARTGDVIAILEGGTVPMALRRCHGGRYEVLGDCYIHGIMDGEALQRAAVVQAMLRIV